MRVQLRLNYEMNRQLQTESELSLADYDVLNALSGAEGESMQVTGLAAQIGWERSRLSHHARRMERRGLVRCDLAASDRRATEITLSAAGRRAIMKAASGHVALVRRLFFGGLPKHQVRPLGDALEAVYEHILSHGTLPGPSSDA
jgi:DNA-binding MarR family transcriptional regulator